MIVLNPRPEVSVVIPAHNEAENLPILLEEIADAEAACGQSFEIVVIDDHSTDATPEVLADLMDRYPRLVVSRMQWQAGQSAALAAGFDAALGDIIVTIDADLQNDPADIPRLLEELDHVDAAIGWRKDRRDPWSKRIISKVANAIRNWATGESVNDTGCGLKAFRRECLDAIPRFRGMHRFLPTLAKMHGFDVAQVPVNHRPRIKGRTHYTIWNRFLGPIVDLWGVRWLQRRALVYRLEKEPALVHH